MNEHLFWEIIPGQGVGPIILGMTLDEVKKQIKFNYSININEYVIYLETDSMRFSFNLDSKKLRFIYLYNNYKGKLLDTISLGCSLTRLEAKFKEVRSYGYIDDENELYPPTTISDVLIYDPQEDEYVIPGATFRFKRSIENKETYLLKSISIHK